MGPRLRNSLVPLREEYRDQNSPKGRKIEIYAPAEFAQPLARKTFSDANVHIDAQTDSVEFIA